VPNEPLGIFARYGLAVAAAVAPVAARLALDALTPAAFPLVAYPAVAAVAAVLGLGPGVVTAVLCGLAPVGLRGAGWSGEVLLFFVGAGVMLALADWMGRTQRAADAVRARFDDELLERQHIEDRLAAANLDLERRLGERDRLLSREQTARTEAQRRQRDAEAAGRAKDEFLAVLGHELRNPLGAISNAIRALHETGDRAVKLQSIIGRQSRHLARLLDDLLDVSRVAVGKVALQPQPVNLYEIAERAVAALEQEQRTGNHELTLHGDAVVVEADALRLEQVARNLLDNALKYTPPGGRVEVVVGREGEEAVLRVVDTGEGIAADVLPRIFEPFIQVGSPDRARGGLGLGLSVVKHLVEVHGGSVHASSGGSGQGSEFIVRLPCLTDVPAAAPVAAADAVKSVPRRVLVIEDHPDVRDGLRMLLETWGHSVVEAADGRRGLELAQAGKVDVALVDVGLPLLDGYSVAKALRAEPAARPLFLVAVTGYGQPADVQRAHAAGFDAVLVKPVDPDALAAVLARLDEPR
jgi:signal transduction histidine kinase/ActR/RegA family two-component response regulator